MFETIAHVLPQYQQLHAACKHQLRFQSQSQDERLAALMSYVYADVIQFCLDVYRMFSRASHGKLLFLRTKNSSIPTASYRFVIRVSKLPVAGSKTGNGSVAYMTILFEDGPIIGDR